MTSTLAFEGEGRIEEYVGGYDDWLRQRDGDRAPSSRSRPWPLRRAPAPKAQPSASKKKRSFNEQREFDALPAKIDALETEQTQLEAAVASPEFYQESADAIRRTLARIEELKAELDRAYARWDELDR